MEKATEEQDPGQHRAVRVIARWLEGRQDSGDFNEAAEAARKVCSPADGRVAGVSNWRAELQVGIRSTDELPEIET